MQWKILSYTIMYLEERINRQIDKMWEFTTKIADVIASERLKSIFSVMCWVYTLMLLTVNIHKSDRVLNCKPSFICDDFI